MVRIRALLRLASAAAVAAAAVAASAAALAQVAPDAVLIRAETLSHDQRTGAVTAAGKVEVTAGPYTLLADRVSFDPGEDRVRAAGNVALLQANGDVVFADELDLTDQLRNGFVSGIRVLMADRSRLAGLRADRQAGNRTELVNAVFTACDACAGDPDPPVWQVKAARVIHNEAARRIDYEDARLEFFGLPVLYTPFFSHPDPTVDRQSGLLAPTYATSSHLGLQVEVPYYFNLAPHRDATFAPVFTGREGVVLAGEYRERTHAGAWRLEGSVTNPRERNGAVRTSGRDVRGHARASGRFDLGPGWRWGFDGARSTDDTYLRRYGISSENTLASNAYVEGFDGRNYAAVNAWAFQGLREDDIPGQTPLVLPMVDYLLVSDPGPQGQTVTIDANLMGLTRNRGTDSWRGSTAGTWRLPYTAPLGDVYTVSASLRGDAYVVSGVPDPNAPQGPTENGFVGRVLPRVAVDWRFPLVRPGPSADLLLEPVVALIVAPRGGNPDKIPNEDSLSFEFDDTNLFSASRFPGLDRWESGPRLNYGLRFGAYGASSSATALLGQTLRDRDPTLFDQRSGLQTGPSDYVGRVHIATPNVDYFQRLRMDQESFSLRRNEIGLRVGGDDLNFTTGYVFLSEELSTENLGRREELSLSGRAPLGNGWRIDAQSRYDLSDPGGLLLAGVGLVYECDCMQFSIDLTRRLTSDRDVPRSTTISLRLRLRHLG